MSMLGIEKSGGYMCLHMYVYVCQGDLIYIRYLLRDGEHEKVWVYVSRVSMLLDVLVLFVCDVPVEVFPITVSYIPGGGKTTH